MTGRDEIGQRGSGTAPGRGWLLCLLFLGLVLPAFAAPPVSHDLPPNKVENPGTSLWLEIRQRPSDIEALKQAGDLGKVTTQAQGVDAGVLINAQGERWRKYRVEWLAPYSMVLLGGVLAFLLLLYVLVARKADPPEESGRRLLRFRDYERTLHWFMAFLFLFLGFTGLLLLYGRPLLLPLVGKEALSVLGSASKEGHNLMGPLFLVSILLFAVRFWRRNIYERGDFTWLLKGGGFLGKAHPKAGFFNMGEKILFWLVVLVGLGISLSGLVLLFPNLGQGRQVMEGAHLIHTLGAVLLLMVVMGHIFMAVAVKGTMDGMNSGFSELNWARQHHSSWAEAMEREGHVHSLEENHLHEESVKLSSEKGVRA